MQNLRQIKLRIKSIENTRKITRAMEMVSAAKLNRVKHMYYSVKNYTKELESVLFDVISGSLSTSSPLSEKRAKIKKTVLCIITSDTGLCGTYNNSVISLAHKYILDERSSVTNIVAIGKGGSTFFTKHECNIIKSFSGLYGRYSNIVADEISDLLIKLFLTGEGDEVKIAYTHFNPSLRHTSCIEDILPINPDKFTSKILDRYSFEPSAQEILNELFPKYLKYKIRAILLESFTAEHSARMLAMKTATENANELTEKLTLARNKARQFAITREVLEIAMSAEALKG